ncbi:type II secretion system F family protein [Thalassotalea aquiviva]|uniref:type II secretion system F family protein n=1 Tax=Thalassotalea aquiviva TaxID=3242415 RepID=UPI00352A5A06
MDFIFSLITSLTDDPMTTRWVVYIGALLAGVTLAVALGFVYSGLYSPVRIKLQKLQNQAVDQQDTGKRSSLEHSLENLSFLDKQFSGDKKTRRLLIHAGFHSENALKLYNALKLLLLLIGLILAAAVSYLFPTLSTFVTFYLVALICGICYLLPGMVITYLANKRMATLRRAFPDALDLLVVCCESGLGLLESLQRVSKEMAFVHPDLSEEISLVCSKVRMGFSMQQALHEFSERTGLEDIRGLNSVIVQSLRLGTGIAKTLRVYADEYRDKRLQQAEEMAAKVGVKMIFPMMVCIWPSFFIVAVGPAILKVLAVFK